MFPFGHGLSYSSFTYANGSAESCGEKEWKAFVVDAGNYELQVAASSRDIRLKMEIVVG